MNATEPLLVSSGYRTQRILRATSSRLSYLAVLFGCTSSPFTLNVTLRGHLKKFNSLMTKDMEKNMYVDNVISLDVTRKTNSFVITRRRDRS